MKTFLYSRMYAVAVLAVMVFALVSCSGDDYLNAVPGNSVAVVSVDVAEMVADGKTDVKQLSLLKSVFGIDDAADCGIDLASNIYLFESADGNLGLVAKVSDKESLNDWLAKLAEKGLCTKTDERSDCRFTTIKDSWVAGFNSDAMVVVGPTIAAQQAAVRMQIVKYLDQNEDDGLKSSPFFARLDSINAPVAMVARVSALPSKFAAPFTLGAPKDADASQIVVAAGMKRNVTGCLTIEGESFSFNKGIDEAMGKSLATLRPITQRYVNSMSEDDAVGVFLNVDGKNFIEMLHANKSLQALLVGVNMAIDMDNIIKSVDGDMTIIMPRYAESGTEVSLGAKLGNKNFLSDVDYWKKSCPGDSKITDWGKDAYCYTTGGMNYYFGVTDDIQYYSGSTPEAARRSIASALKPLPQDVRSLINGKRLCMVLNIGALLGGNDETKALMPVLKPMLGDVETIVYCIK